MHKKITSIFFVILTFAFLFISKPAVAQRNNIQTIFYADSLTGFDEQAAKVKAMLDNCFGNEFIVFISKAKRNYIKEKYQLLTESASFKPAFSGNNQIMALCTNMDFEAGNLGGWTLTSGTNANSTTMAGCCGTPGGAATAVVPSVGNDPISNAPLASPFGGGFICRINDVNVGAVVERISQTFTVTPANSLLQYAFMAVLESAGHTCAEQPYLNIRLLDCNNNIIPCPQAQISAPSGQCPSNDPGFQNGAGYSFHTAWQISALDLTPYVGSCITVQITVGDCTQSGHAGYAYFDAQCSPMNITVNGVSFPVGTNASTVAVCGANTATITAPPNLGPYIWNGPAGSGVNNVANQTFTTVTQGQYTLSMNPLGSCAPIIRLVNFSVSVPPQAAFTFTSIPCASSVNVNSTSSLNGGTAITGYQWTWGDATPNATVNPASHGYLSSGPKAIKLVVTNATGCKDSITQTVNVTLPPLIDFTVNPACLGLNTNFTNISTTGGAASINFTWTFGSGGVSTATNPSITFATPGAYSVSLTGTNSDNCSNTIQKTYTVYPKPVINFTANAVCFGTATSFTNSSTIAAPSTITNWLWDFNNDAITDNTTQTPTNMYASGGIFSVELKAVSDVGCTDSLVKSVTVYNNPTADFVSDSVCIGNPTTLTGTSNLNGLPPLFFSWDWNSDGVADATNNLPSTQNTFTTYGNIPVTYTVITSPNGGLLNCVNSITKNIWVHPGPSASITYTNQCIDAQPLPISGITSTIPVGSITNYAWSYGNGNFNATNPSAATSHSYSSAGIYVVTLTVTSNNGCESVTTNSVQVYDRPYGNFSYSKTCFNKTTTLTAIPSASGAPVVNYSWDFNNSPTTVEASGVQVSTTFSAAGQQTLNLLLTTAFGCKNTIPGNIYINYNPKANFYAPKRAGCTDLCISILDSSSVLTGPAKNVSWEWDFGNGQLLNSASNGANKQCYSNSSHYNVKKYSVSLIVRSDSGCVDSVSKKGYVSVYPKPRADFNWIGEEGDILTPVISFTNTSEGHSNFQWYFNDALNALDSTNNNPKHYFTTDDPKTVNVYLAIRNSYGCKDTIMRPIDIGPNFTFYIPNCFTPNDDGINDTFTGKGIGIKDYKMWIFDRWGEMLYYTNDIFKGWDGSVKGHEVDGKTDVYQWKVIVTDLTNKAHYYVGHVTQLK